MNHFDGQYGMQFPNQFGNNIQFGKNIGGNNPSFGNNIGGNLGIAGR